MDALIIRRRGHAERWMSDEIGPDNAWKEACSKKAIVLENFMSSEQVVGGRLQMNTVSLEIIAGDEERKGAAGCVLDIRNALVGAVRNALPGIDIDWEESLSGATIFVVNGARKEVGCTSHYLMAKALVGFIETVNSGPG